MAREADRLAVLITSIVVALILTLSLAGQAVVFRRFAKVFSSSEPVTSPSEPRPNVTVILPVRNGNQRLSQAIESVLQQDYPDLGLLVVVDSIHDPAHEIAVTTITSDDHSRARVILLEQRRQDCGLVCSSLLQALEELDPDTEIIAFAAADTILPRPWVSELVTTLDQPGTAATLGNRWYHLDSNSPGDVIQFLWNAGAVVPMWLFSIPWAGALALRRQDITATGLPRVWQRTIVEDTPVVAALWKAGKRLTFSPQLFVGIDESVDLPTCIRFICRQMLWTRLYHPDWPRISLSVFAGATAVWLPILAFPVAVSQAAWPAAGIFLAAGIGYLAGLLLLMARLHSLVGGVLRARGEPHSEFGATRLLVLLAAIPMAQLISLYSVVNAIFATHVWWSGIRYHLKKDGAVIMEDPSATRHARRPATGCYQQTD